MQPQTPPTQQRVRQAHYEQLSSRANFESWLAIAGMAHYSHLFEIRKCDRLSTLFDMGPDHMLSMLKRSGCMRSNDITLFMINYTLGVHMLKDGSKNCKVLQSFPRWLQELQTTLRHRKSSRPEYSES